MSENKITEVELNELQFNLILQQLRNMEHKQDLILRSLDGNLQTDKQ